MEAFFHTIILISSFTGLIILYFLVRNGLHWYKQRKNADQRHRDEVEQKLRENSNFFLSLSDKIQKDKILWFEVSDSSNEKRMLIQKAPSNTGYLVSLTTNQIDEEIKNFLVQKKESKLPINNFQCTINFNNTDALFQIFTAVINKPGTGQVKFNF